MQIKKALAIAFLIFLLFITALTAQDENINLNDKNKSSSLEKKDETKKNKYFEYSGYLRSGASMHGSGGSSSGGACFSVPHQKWNGAYFRLGNDCLDYGILTLGSNILESKGTRFKAVATIDVISDQRNSVSRVDWFPRLRELHAEGHGLLWGETTVWAGKKMYIETGGFDDPVLVSMLDFFPVVSSGNGIGLGNISLGSDKLKLHVSNFWYALRFSNTNEESADNFTNRGSPYFRPTPADRSVLTMPDLRVEADLQDLNLGVFSFAIQLPLVFQVVNPDGIKDEFADISSSLSLQWKDSFFNFWYLTLGSQLGTGMMAHNPGCASTDGPSDCVDSIANASHLGFRAYTTGYFHFETLKFFKLAYSAIFELVDNRDRLIRLNESNQIEILYDDSDGRNDEIPDGIYRGDHTWISLGISPHFMLTDYLSFILLYGINISSSPEPIKSEGVDSFFPDAKYTTENRILHHASIALQISGDSQNITNRTSIRIFVSYFAWNQEWNTYRDRRPTEIGNRYIRDKLPLERAPDRLDGNITSALIIGVQGEAAF